jgi:ATP-dependent helicase/nuclease subunit B
MKHSLNCVTIPAEKAFINFFAAWVLERYGKDEAILANTLVLLPNRRACRSLRDAFLAITAGKPLLLPRIQPLGDMDEDAATIHFAADTKLLPPISLLRRELLLIRLIMQFKSLYHNVEQAAELARQLGRFIDDVAREGLSFDQLSALVPEELATHWQQTLDFLALVSHHWPKILEGEGALDVIEHRNRLLKAVAKNWREQPPAYPIIAAGSTGSQPTTAALLSVIARLPQGMVVLPGLDTDMPEREWEMVSETHPQYGMKQLLDAMKCKRSDIKPLQDEKSPAGPRIACLRAILQPPEATAHWKKVSLPLAEGLKDVRLLTADTLSDEACLIAIALRETLETPGKTAALITPDRGLAQMVAAQMQRFGITIDDSAGYPLMDTPPACFLRLAADMAASDASPASLLALLRHPLAGTGKATSECRRLSRVLEIDSLRGIRRTPGLESLIVATDDKATKQWLADVAEHMKPFTECFKKPHVPLATIVRAHIRFAEWLASTDELAGAARLWEGDAGNQLAAFVAGLLEQAELLPQVDPITYPGLFETLLAGQTYRPRWGLHPRLQILSPMEARLLNFDRVILGSLNEGMWPSTPSADPWMSRPMRKEFGLPAPERTIGQSAHDFYLLAAAPEVIVSRARKVEGTPTVPSRWLVRLETLVNGLDAGFLNTMRCDAHYNQGRHLLDAPADIPKLVQPEPKPPLEARPRQLRVTAIDTWLRDPYMIYAKYILKLEPLEPLDRAPDAADFGTLVHAALEQFTRNWPQALPDNAYEKLLECGRVAFADFIDRPAVACLWWPRFEAMAEWLIDIEKERRSGLASVRGELNGIWQFDVGGRPFTLKTRIDRMEVARDGAVTLIDYKTGYIPTNADMERGLANQLPLEALVVMYGKLEPYEGKVSTVQGLEYWKLAGNADRSDIRAVGTGEIIQSKTQLETLIRRFDDDTMPYKAPADPSLIVRFNDYEHLTRRDEWEKV